ncbi:MAG: class I SAM-dependent methyltransferase, partial [Planctomyces sp.]
LQLLRIGGVMTIACYRGHAGGAEEANAVVSLIQTLPEISFETQIIVSDQSQAGSPLLCWVRKLNG